jgi:hypothetical protein
LVPPGDAHLFDLSHQVLFRSEAWTVVESPRTALTALRGRSTVLVIEQYVMQALAMSDSVIVLSRGRIAYTGRSAELTTGAIKEICSLAPAGQENAGPVRAALA